MNIRSTLASAALALVSATTFAQSPATATPRVDARQAEQAQRIEQGRASGELTRHEAHSLKREQRHIARAKARAQADGVVTAKERARLARLQDHASRDIARDRHNARTVAPRL